MCSRGQAEICEVSPTASGGGCGVCWPRPRRRGADARHPRAGRRPSVDARVRGRWRRAGGGQTPRARLPTAATVVVVAGGDRLIGSIFQTARAQSRPSSTVVADVQVPPRTSWGFKSPGDTWRTRVRLDRSSDPGRTLSGQRGPVLRVCDSNQVLDPLGHRASAGIGHAPVGHNDVDVAFSEVSGLPSSKGTIRLAPGGAPAGRATTAVPSAPQYARDGGRLHRRPCALPLRADARFSDARRPRRRKARLGTTRFVDADPTQVEPARERRHLFSWSCR
jgi:hypothetical protein